MHVAPMTGTGGGEEEMVVVEDHGIATATALDAPVTCPLRNHLSSRFGPSLFSVFDADHTLLRAFFLVQSVFRNVLGNQVAVSIHV